jgi:hypothetical protein
MNIARAKYDEVCNCCGVIITLVIKHRNTLLEYQEILEIASGFLAM